jgi:putative spermidine/putrescine transport system substrate-binding protein
MRMLGYVVALSAALAASSATAASVKVATAGDQNMVDYVKDVLAPMFEKANPGEKVVAVGTGPGDAGSQKIYEKLAAQKQAGVDKWDFDVIVIHQKMAGQMVKENLLATYTHRIPTGALATRDTARMALGADVAGFVMPMFHSQTAIAYNPDIVKDVPDSYAELVDG